MTKINKPVQRFAFIQVWTFDLFKCKHVGCVLKENGAEKTNAIDKYILAVGQDMSKMSSLHKLTLP